MIIVCGPDTVCVQTIECPAVWKIPVHRRLVIAHYAEYHYASVQEKRFGDVVEDKLEMSIGPAAYAGSIEPRKSDLHSPDGILVGPGHFDSGAPGESP